MIDVRGACALLVGLAIACHPSPGEEETDSTESAGSTGSTGPEPDAFEEQNQMYEACGPPLAPLCVSLECATDEVSTKYMTMVVEEIEAAGVGDRIRATNGRVADPDQFLYHLQGQVEWYRYWTPGYVRITDPDDEVRTQIRHGIELLADDLPAAIIDRELVTQRAAECDGMAYSLCTGHVSPGSIYFLRETGDPCAGGRTDEFAIDLVTGESMCTLDAPVSCG